MRAACAEKWRAGVHVHWEIMLFFPVLVSALEISALVPIRTLRKVWVTMLGEKMLALLSSASYYFGSL